MLLFLCWGIGNVWAEDTYVTYALSDFSDGASNIGGNMTITQHTPITLTATGYKNTSYVQFYANNTMTISANTETVAAITKIEVVHNDKYGNFSINTTGVTGNVSMASSSGGTSTITISTENVTTVEIKNTANGQARFTSIKIYYTPKTITQTPCTITWNVTGSTMTELDAEYTTQNQGETIKMPTPEVPTSCTGKTFVGWTEANEVDPDGDELVLLNATAAVPAQSSITYNAVFANVTRTEGAEQTKTANGKTASGKDPFSCSVDNSDYSDNDCKTKFKNTGHYIAFNAEGKTITNATINWKTLGASSSTTGNSSIKLEGSTDGTNYTTIQEFDAISSTSNSTEGSNEYTTALTGYKSIRWYFTKGTSGFNIGVNVSVTYKESAISYSDYTLSCTAPTGYSITLSEVMEHGTVTVTPKKLGLTEGTTVTLTPVPDDGYEFVSWMVDDGEDFIDVEDNQFEMPTANVTVEALFKAKEVTGIAFDITEKTLAADDAPFTLTVFYTPADVIDAKKEVVWLSENDNIATVDNNGKVTPVGAGTVAITATLADDENIVATCNVTVTAVLPKIVITKTTSGISGTSYSANQTFTQDGVTFTYNNWISSGDFIQAQKNNANSVYNTTAIPGIIKSITVVTGAEKTARAVTIQGSITGETDPDSYETITAPTTAMTMVFDCSDKAYRYFNLSTPGNACYFEKIIIVYEPIMAELTYTDIYMDSEEELIGMLTIKNGENTINADKDATIQAGTELTVELDAEGDYVGTVKVVKTGVTPEEDVTSAVYKDGKLTMPEYNITVSANFVEGVQVPVFDPEEGTFTDEQLIEISCSTTGATIYYNINSGDDPTDESTAYDANEGITLDARGTHTIKAIAYKNGKSSEVATATYTLDLPYSIADFISEKPASDVLVDITGAVVLGQTSANIYLQKDDKALLLYKNSHSKNEWTRGKKLTGSVYGKHGTYNGMNEMVVNYFSADVDGDGTMPEPVEITPETEDITLYYGRLVTIKGVYFQAQALDNDGDVEIVDNADPEDENASPYYVYNAFSLFNKTTTVFPLTETVCDVTGILYHKNTNNDNYVRVLPTQIEDISTREAYATLPTVSLAGGEDTEHAVEVASGKKITITPAVGTKVTYNITDDVVITEETNVTLSGENEMAIELNISAEREFYEFNMVTYYYVINEALSEHNINCATGLTGGEISASPATAAQGETIILTATPAAHYSFGEWAVIYNDGEEKTITPDENNQFTMPAYDVMVSATFNEDAKYSVTFAKGAATATGDAPTMDAQYEDEQITLPANTFTYTGHKFTGWNDGTTTYAAGATYTMPDHAVTFTAQWEQLSVWATTYTSNVTMSSDENKSVEIEETTYPAVKANKGNKATITIPANTEKLHIHIAAWNGEGHTATLKYGDVTENITIVADNGISGSKTTYELTAASAPTDYYFSFDMADITEETTVTITAANSKRFVLFGVNAEVTTLDVAENKTISEDASYGNVIVEAGKALTVNADLTVTGDLTLRANGDVKPEMNINGNVTVSGTMSYEWTVTAGKDYPVSMPCDVNLADIKYWDGNDWNADFGMMVAEYDGAKRAAEGEAGNSAEHTTNWKYLQGPTLVANKGYIIRVEGGMTGSVKLYFPLSTLAEADNVSVAANAELGNNAEEFDKGWNFVGNQFFAAAGTSEVAGCYIMVNNGEKYDLTEEKVAPFTGMFVQVGNVESITFSKNYTAPSSIRAENQEDTEVTVKVALDEADYFGLRIADKYTTAYELTYDLLKMFGTAQAMAIYTLEGDTRLAYNAMPNASAEAIPVGFSATEGEHTIALINNPALEHLYLTDHLAGIVTDLLSSDYTFESDGEMLNDTRFELNAVRAGAGQTTAIYDEYIQGAGVQKVLMDGKVYIIRNGVWYNAMGQMVK